ncbi:PAAR domain-containing protein [Paraburkholderia pallida]|nr:PAAR domain-containing protein [Paraburkholderia pallida]
MLRRYLCIGDAPETGGMITPHPGRPYTIRGYQAAIIGGEAFCAACKTTGKITKAGGPRRHIHCGNELALDGDILLCGCPTPPRILATRQSIAWHEDMGYGRGQRGSAQDIEPIPLLLVFDEQVQPVGHGASTGYPYFIEASDGQQFAGRLDESGALPRVNTALEDSYKVYWGEEALTHQGWK